MKKEIGLGFLIGLIAPLLMLFVLSFTPFNKYDSSFVEFIKASIKANALPALFSLCAILNLVIFWVLNKRDEYNLAKGVIFGTFIYAFYIAWNKLL